MTMNKWSEIPYPGQVFTPIGETPLAGNWPLNYFPLIYLQLLLYKNGLHYIEP